MLHQYIVLPLVALKTTVILLLLLILVKILVTLVGRTGILEKTVQFAKPFVTNLKRKVILQVCQSKRNAVSAGVPSSLSHTIENVFVNNTKFSASIHNSSSENFISSEVISKLKISYQDKIGLVSIATPNLKSRIKGYCILSITLKTQTYNNIIYNTRQLMCKYIRSIFFGETVIMLSFEGDLPPLNIFILAVSNVTPPTLFIHLSNKGLSFHSNKNL